MSSNNSTKPQVKAKSTNRFRRFAAIAALVVAWLIALGYLGMALKLSFGHIIDASLKLGVSPDQAHLAPFAFDGIAVAGKLLTLPLWDAKTRRTGWIFMAVGGGGSFAANVYAGDTLGDQIFGGMIVGLFVLVEWGVGRIRLDNSTAPAPVKAPRQPLTDEQREARRAKAAQREADKAAERDRIAAAAVAAERDRIAAEKQTASEQRKAQRAAKAAAPVSPGAPAAPAPAVPADLAADVEAAYATV